MFYISGQMADLIRTKLGTWIHLDPGTVSGRSQHHRHKNGGAAGTEKDRGGVNTVGTNALHP